MINIWDMHQHVLLADSSAKNQQSKNMAKSGILAIAENSAALHTDTLINGVERPILAVRWKEKQCKLTALEGETLSKGDVIENLFSERWLVVSVYSDENEITRGTAWQVNHLFKFQNGSCNKVIERYGVIDDGTYASVGSNHIPLESGKYRLYLPLDDHTDQIFIGKRFGVRKIYDHDAREILSVLKVGWIDRSNSLLTMIADVDQYQKGIDNIDALICNYITNKDEINCDEIYPYFSIQGADKIRVGTSREYVLFSSKQNDNTEILEDFSLECNCDNVKGIKVTSYKNTLRIAVDNNIKLVGSILNIVAFDSASMPIGVAKQVEVIA